VLQSDGVYRNFQATDYAYASWRARQTAEVSLPDYFVTADDVAARDHLLMQAALQPFVDGAISKTINLRRDMSREELPQILASAFELGLRLHRLRAAARRG
jgi:ribonucleoside-diphosphate reductase alpha chain